MQHEVKTGDVEAWLANRAFSDALGMVNPSAQSIDVLQYRGWIEATQGQDGKSVEHTWVGHEGSPVHMVLYSGAGHCTPDRLIEFYRWPIRKAVHAAKFVLYCCCLSRGNRDAKWTGPIPTLMNWDQGGSALLGGERDIESPAPAAKGEPPVSIAGYFDGLVEAWMAKNISPKERKKGDVKVLEFTVTWNALSHDVEESWCKISERQGTGLIEDIGTYTAVQERECEGLHERRRRR